MYSNSTSVAGYNAAFARFLKTVFNYMSGGVAISGLVAYLTLTNGNLMTMATSGSFYIVFLVVWFGFGIFANNIIRKVSTGAGIAMFIAFSAITGMAFAPTVGMYAPELLISAFFITSAIFASMSMFGLSTKKSLSGWGVFLSMASWGLIAAIIVNIVLAAFFEINTSFFSIMISMLIVPLVSAGVAYELNMLRDMFSNFEDNEKVTADMAITSAVSLYTSFVVLFIHILRLLGALTSND